MFPRSSDLASGSLIEENVSGWYVPSTSEKFFSSLTPVYAGSTCSNNEPFGMA
jgi:hypothetical protein